MTHGPLQFRSLSVIEDRTDDLKELGGGEGFAVYVATFDGMPAVIIDQGTLLDIFPDEEDENAVLVHVFETEDNRAAFLSRLALR